ncbi:polysaccharide pyruvyl transferase family protein, partial [Roseibium sp.]|uniref:polysaccharide pyruvyl transferase family protein n=1 Tax=Roseibium sp. TaxID=1936156 RepID=UPI0032987CE5
MQLTLRSMIDSIKGWVPLKLKQRVRSIVVREDLDLSGDRRAFLFLAADYGNIGDIAITAAQEHFLKSHAGQYNVVVVPISKTRSLLRSIKKQITPSDLVTIVGGGNMGSLYPEIEALRQLVIRSFPRNRIVCFPQTLDWEDSPESAKAIERIVDIYSGHGDLHVFAREAVSRDKLRDLFSAHDSVRVGYAPDVVLSATATDLGADAVTPRDGILLCMRG